MERSLLVGRRVERLHLDGRLMVRSLMVRSLMVRSLLVRGLLERSLLEFQRMAGGDMGMSVRRPTLGLSWE